MTFYQLYANNTDINTVKTRDNQFLFGKEGETVKFHFVFKDSFKNFIKYN